jgi:hypothetical protein
MNTRLFAHLPLVLLLCLCLSGCNKDKDEGKEVLGKVCPYFPDAVLYKFDKRVIWIQTKVDGVGSQTAALIFQNACQQAKYNLGNLIKFNITELMNLDGRSILIIGFKQYMVTWIVSNGVDARGVPRCEVMTWQQAPSWFLQNVGYRPTPDKIRVETQQDAQNASENQPMQLPTLAQIQAQNREKQQ